MNFANKIWIFCLFLGTLDTIAQQQFKDNLSIRADLHTGVIIPEYQLFNQIVNDYVYSAEVSFQKQSSGRHERDQLFNYPEFGVSCLYTSLGNNDIFGHEIAVYGYFMTHLIRREKFQLNHQFGLGPGYATRKFSLEDNHMNVAVGSHLNLHFNYKLGTCFKLSEKWSLNAGLSFAHYSNANMSEPNLGVNSFTFYSGTNYLLGKRILEEKKELPKFTGSNEFAFIGAIGGKHTRALQSTVYFTSSLSAEYRRHISRKIRLGGGLDLFYDSSTKTEMSVPGAIPYKSIYDFRSGVHLSQEIAYGNFSFILQEGVYLGLTNKVDASKIMYNRGIIRWKFKDRYLLQITMKSHLHILDYPELGFGYWFKKSKS